MSFKTETVGQSTTITIGLADRDGRPHDEQRAARLIEDVMEVIHNAGLPVFFTGRGTGQYTNEQGVTYREPTFCVIVGGVVPPLVSASVSYIVTVLDDQESYAMTTGSTALVSGVPTGR